MNTNTNAGVNTNGAQTPATSSESIKAQQLAMLGPLRPRWCIQRDGNTVVPLIAIDELPDSVLLKGVPSTLTVLEALKARMELIAGDHPAHGTRYQLYQPCNPQTVANEEGNGSGSDGSPGSERSESSTQKGSLTFDKKGNKVAVGNGSEGSKSKDKLPRPTLTANDTSIVDTLAKKGTMGKKVYCTYWIQTGNCNYMQEGCKYKHEIPKDEETRRAIGFREFPNWPREELPIQTKPTALLKPWRRPEGKPEHPGAPGPSRRTGASPAAGHGAPIILARGNSQASTHASNQGHAANTQYNPNATAFAASHQHFPTHANYMAQQRPFYQGGQPFLGNGAAENYQQRSAQNTASPPLYDGSATASPPPYNRSVKAKNGGHSRSASPPQQPPISRPNNLGQSPVGQQKNNAGASTQKVAPDYHIIDRASGASEGASTLKVAPDYHIINRASGASEGASTQKVAPDYHIIDRASGASEGGAAASFVRQGYSGMPNNWNPQTNAPTSMDISFIAPSDSTRSDSQALYTPTYTPTLNGANTFGSLNGKAPSDSRASTPAHYSRNSSANTGNGPAVKGRGSVQFGRHSPAPSTGSVRHPFQASAVHADESDAASVTSPPVQHRVFFREPGQPEFVTNPPEPKGNQNGKAAHAMKKHPRKGHTPNGSKSAKGKMSGNGYDVLVDMNDQQ